MGTKRLLASGIRLSKSLFGEDFVPWKLGFMDPQIACPNSLDSWLGPIALGPKPPNTC